jgi:hypothetical protein
VLVLIYPRLTDVRIRGRGGKEIGFPVHRSELDLRHGSGRNRVCVCVCERERDRNPETNEMEALQKLIVLSWLRNSQPLVDPAGSVPYSKEPDA